ncbi:hypothetical protein FHX63_004182, partial [Cupriavidus plantarum]|nr:hypothetical protein [Cupriavidus plantarum]
MTNLGVVKIGLCLFTGTLAERYHQARHTGYRIKPYGQLVLV